MRALDIQAVVSNTAAVQKAQQSVQNRQLGTDRQGHLHAEAQQAHERQSVQIPLKSPEAQLQGRDERKQKREARKTTENNPDAGEMDPLPEPDPNLGSILDLTA